MLLAPKPYKRRVNRAHLLWLRFEECTLAQRVWMVNQYKLRLTDQERNAFRNHLIQATTNLTAAKDVVRRHDTLVLTTVSEATVFVALLQEFLDNRGHLQRVQVVNVNDEIKRLIRSRLEAAGFTPQETNDFYNFP
ncbi:uncharacterized protein J3R85_004311 [Psidium guajava]|nr:uncharacterized protein J3R85_004311 [Psidium guajava]